jgi:hypothetical protein
MAELNVSFEHFYSFMRVEHMYGHDGRSGVIPCIVFGAQSVGGTALTFHVMLENGAIRSRVPIHMLCWKEESPKMALDYLQLWDCFGEDVVCTCFDYLKQSRVQVHFKDKTTAWGNYMMTFDWYGNGFSNEPSQYKCAHLIKLDSGCYALQPNNRLVFKDMSFVNKPIPEKPDWHVDDKKWVCEGVSEKWIINDESYFSDIKNTEDSNAGE